MQKIKIPYGYQSYILGTITIFTGKIRLQIPKETAEQELQNFREFLSIRESFSAKTYKSYTTIEFSVQSIILQKQLIDAIRQMTCKMMHERIDKKYSYKFSSPFQEIEEIILPF